MEKVLWGAATASFQIEGAGREGGRTPSIWDTFCETPGKVLNGDDGLVACDHYHRYKEDVALMKELGLQSYRFSIAWPRIFPHKGQYNPEGMQFYKNLIAELQSAGIEASVTLYHWDLPQWAQDEGGWENRECVDWFLEYANKCFAELGDTVSMWITHNEPWCATILSYYIGEHAPGKHDLEAALVAAHHVLLSHGLAVRAYRKTGLTAPIGITLNLSAAYAASDSFTDRLALAAYEGSFNRWFLDPLFKASYPQDTCMLYAARCGTDFEFIQPGDLAAIAEKTDFLGINYYSQSVQEYSSAAPLLSRPAYTDKPKTQMGWDITPYALVDQVRMLRAQYTQLPIYVTENGSAWPDEVSPDGRVHDEDRVQYLLQHLAAVEQMNQEGLRVAGYFAWSLLDNFEWAFGYARRFGLIHVDYDTQKRTPKDSFYAYQSYIKVHR